MHKRLLVTGLGIGEKLGLCDPCNINYSWIFQNPSTLLWCDKICIPKDLFEKALQKPEEKYDIAVATALETLLNYHLLELIDDKTIEDAKPREDFLETRFAEDLLAMSEMFPDNVKYNSNAEVHERITIDGMHFCLPYVLSIYASLFLAQSINAQCLFDSRDYSYLKYKMGINYRELTGANQFKTYNEVFSFVLPDEIFKPNHTMVNSNDIAISDPTKQFEHIIRSGLKRILEYREYDELYLLRKEIDNIVKSHEIFGSQVSAEDIKKELAEKQRKISMLINRRFPQVKRMAKYTTIVAIPATILSAATGNIPATVASAALGGISKGAEELMAIYESKKKWVGFIKA